MPPLGLATSVTGGAAGHVFRLLQVLKLFSFLEEEGFGVVRLFMVQGVMQVVSVFQLIGYQKLFRLLFV